MEELKYSPKVSIVVPVYKTEKYLPQCLDSLIHQTLKEIEIIVVNDGSPDNSADVIKKYAEIDSRIKYIEKENGGCGDAYNAGMAVATGEYIGFLDSDDWAELTMFENLYRAASEKKVDIVRAGAFICEWANRSFLRVMIPAEKCNRIITKALDIPEFVMSHMSQWSSIYRRRFLKENHIQCPTKKGCIFCPDLGFAYHCWLTAKSFYVLPFAGVHYRQDNPNADQFIGQKYYGQTLNGHLAARKIMKSLGERVKPEHWKIKAITEFVHFREAIEMNNTPPKKFIMAISRIFRENLKKKYISKNDLEYDLFKVYQCIAKHPLLYWSNLKFKFWYTKHQKNGEEIFWFLAGLYKRKKTDWEIITSVMGIPVKKRMNFERRFSLLEQRLDELERRLSSINYSHQ